MNKILFSCYIYYMTSISIVHTNLNDKLYHYDTLNKLDIHHKIIRRSIDNKHDRHISFSSHGKQFHMYLEQTRDIFSPSSRTVSVDKYGNEHPFTINMNSFYKGYIEEDTTSEVTAHVDDDGMVTATVVTVDETYVVEPMWRHVDNDPTHDMIVYKASDLKWNMTNLCYVDSEESRDNMSGTQASNFDDKNNIENSVEDNDWINERSRRSAQCDSVDSKNTCNLMLVADYSFFKTMGRSHKATTAYYMFHTILKVDRIFRKTCWKWVGRNIGMQVKETRVHEELTLDGYEPRFNRKPKSGTWDVNKLLEQFSLEDWSGYCLAHLFTYNDFDDGVIGLAYIAKENRRHGGICSPKNDYNNRHENSALTTYMNFGRPLTTLEAAIVTAHEIGHNFGARHDDAKRCSSAAAGKYIMYETSVSGKHDNNKIFSPCSRDDIGGVLRRKRNRCFTDKDSDKCGNSNIDEGEECDPGPVTNDKCCFKNCTLTPGSKCSDYNRLCCMNCQIVKSSSKTICSDSSTIECKGEIRCDGKSPDCPEEAPKLNGEECVTNSSTGICRDGKCESYCSVKTTNGPCECVGNDACNVCCNQSNVCQPFRTSNGYVNEANGSLCHVIQGEGLCIEGKCQPLQEDLTDKFPTFENMTLQKAIILMENNIVLTVIIFSLLIWIPASCIVNYLDKEEDDAISIKRSISVESERNLRVSPTNSGFQNVVTGQHLGTYT